MKLTNAFHISPDACSVAFNACDLIHTTTECIPWPAGIGHRQASEVDVVLSPGCQHCAVAEIGRPLTLHCRRKEGKQRDKEKQPDRMKDEHNIIIPTSRINPSSSQLHQQYFVYNWFSSVIQISLQASTHISKYGNILYNASVPLCDTFRLCCSQVSLIF